METPQVSKATCKERCHLSISQVSQFCSFPSAPMLACGVPRESPEAPWRRRDLVRSRGEMCAVSCTVLLAERPVAFFIYLH